MRKADFNPSPFKQFKVWFAESGASGSEMPEAVALATADSTGAPSARMVLFKGIYHGGFGFFTNYQSLKAKKMEANPRAALLFYWHNLGRQVRITGHVRKMEPGDSDTYFHTRDRESQIGAWASIQSQPIENRDELIRRFAAFEQKFSDQPIPRPPHWGGYILAPTDFEFWQNRPHRLHDRLRYKIQGEQGWIIERLNP